MTTYKEAQARQLNPANEGKQYFYVEVDDDPANATEGLIFYDDHGKLEGKTIKLPDDSPPPIEPVKAIIKPETPQQGKPSDIIELDGSDSTGEEITFDWSIASGPVSVEGSTDQAKAKIKINDNATGDIDGLVRLLVQDKHGTVNIATRKIIVSKVDPQPIKIPITSVTASDDDGNTPQEAIDGNLDTRWSADGRGEWIELNFDAQYKVKLIKIAFYKGTARQAFFIINGERFNSSGQTNDLQEFVPSSDIINNKLRIRGEGNSSNEWNSLTEIEVWGVKTGDNPPPPGDKITETELELQREIEGDQSPGTGDVDAKFDELLKDAKAGETVILDGSQSSGNIDNWSITQIAGTPTVQLSDTSKNYSKQFIMPSNADDLEFELKVWNSEDEDTDKVNVRLDDNNSGGEIDEHGIQWLVAKGDKTIIDMTRDRDDDDRWSGNVTGLRNGFEATFIGKSKGVAGDGHFAMKQFGPNHSGCTNSRRCGWYDTGLRANGDVQLETEQPHPRNHDFDLPDSQWFIKNIGKRLEGNWIGLKWCGQTLRPNGSPTNGGIRCRMWVDRDPIGSNGRPNNNWELVYDFVDNGDILEDNWEPRDEQDCEIRRSDTDNHDVYGDGRIYTNVEDGDPGLHVRRL